MSTPCEQGGLHSIEQAISTLTTLLRRPLDSTRQPLATAQGKTLAVDLPARLDVPRWDNSAMDGYALNSADLDPATPWLPVAGCQAAGDPPSTLPAGHCMQIFTGAMLPAGADTVIPAENCRIDNGRVLFGLYRAGQNIRRQGEETQAGQLLLTRGTRLDSRHIGLLASQGYAEIDVYQPLRIGILSSGNELCEPGETLADGQIYDTNSFLLASLLQGWGFSVTRYPRMRDELEASKQQLVTAAAEQDILISSGGVSVGDADYLKTAVEQLGQLSLWRVAIQPGKPLAFGRIGDTPWIGLPGNPGASLVTALIIARPALLAAQGLTDAQPQTLRVQSGFKRSKIRVRQQYLQARLNSSTGSLQAVLHPQQSSAMLANCCWADGLVVIPAQHSVATGDLLQFIPYFSLL